MRANAASLLIDAFPFQNPSADMEENDELLQKQIDVLLVNFILFFRSSPMMGVNQIPGDIYHASNSIDVMAVKYPKFYSFVLQTTRPSSFPSNFVFHVVWYRQG